ncbi:MAG: PcfJ domain-containing protein [Polyangiales bacterium]
MTTATTQQIRHDDAPLPASRARVVKPLQLLAWAGDVDEAARLDAVNGVASLLTDEVLHTGGVDARPVLPSLLRLRRDAELGVRLAAVVLLGRIGRAVPEVHGQVVRALRLSAARDPADALRRCAAAVLDVMSPYLEELTMPRGARVQISGARLGKLCIPWLVRVWHLSLEARAARSFPSARQRRIARRATWASAPAESRASDRLITALHAHLLKLSTTSEEEVLRDEAFRLRDHQIRALFRDAARRPEAARDLDVAAMLALFAPLWLRPFERWPLDMNMHTLAAHLLARFEVPGRLRWTWYWYCGDVVRGVRTSYGEYPLKRIVWFILFGGGASLRTAAKCFGWNIPKGFVHAYVQDEEVRRAMVCAVGGTRDDAARLYAMDALVDPTETPDDLIAAIARRTYAHATLGEAPDRVDAYCRTDREDATARRAHWFGAARWLIRHRGDLDAPTSQRVLAWAHERFLAMLALRPPVYAGAAEFWHALSLNAARALGWPEEVTWQARGFGGALRDDEQGELWSIVELTSLGALRVEGALMHHCVGCYGRACKAGDSVILSVRRGDVRVATVEIDPRTLTIAQMSGFANRALDAAEDRVVQRWYATLPRPE